VEVGKPVRDGKYRLYISLSKLVESNNDGENHQFEDLFEIPLQNDETIFEAKKRYVGSTWRTIKNILTLHC